MKRKRDYTVVCTDDDPNWLVHRQKYVTASSVAAMFNMSKWSTREKLIEEKLAEDPHRLKDSNNMWHGRYDEKHNMDKFALCMDVKVRHAHYLLGTDYGLGATLDGLVSVPSTEPKLIAELTSTNPTARTYMGNWMPALRYRMLDAGGVGILEMKQTDAWWYKDWQQSVPKHYYYQVQAQLLVTGAPWAVIAAQIGSANFMGHFVEPNLDVQETIKDATIKFWKEIEELKTW